MLNKLLSYLTPLVLIVVLIFQIILFGRIGTAFGGDTNYDSVDVTDGYKVDGTTVIDGSGNYDGAVTPSSIVNTGALTQSGAATFSAETRLNTPRITGSITALTAGSTSSVSAANVCDSAILTWTPTVASASATLPTAAAMFADCLTTNGDTWEITFRNLAVAASTTIIAANTSTTLVGVDANSDVIDGVNEAVLKFVRASATELLVIIREFTAAD